jgi:bifunctional non-homologous end joining protein LigD
MAHAQKQLLSALRTLSQHGLASKVKFTEKVLKPELAMLVDEVPTGKDWIFETKYDGYRILAFRDRSRLKLFSRNGKDWTSRFANICHSLENLPFASFVVDGEIVTLDAKGLSSFSTLQRTLSEERLEGFTYFAFDLLYLEGYDLRSAPLLMRKKLLAHLMKSLPRAAKQSLRLSEYTQRPGQFLFDESCRKHMEGIIAKDASKPYRPGRFRDWLKIKCNKEDEFVVGGFTDPRASRSGFGSLLLGYYNSRQELIYAGRVGTGFDEKTLTFLRKKLGRIERKQSPFKTSLSSLERKGAHFVRPELVAQIAFTEWTAEAHLRHPVFLGLREDKAAQDVRLEKTLHLRRKNGSRNVER